MTMDRIGGRLAHGMGVTVTGALRGPRAVLFAFLAFFASAAWATDVVTYFHNDEALAKLQT